MYEDLTVLELSIVHDLVAHTKRVKGTDAMTRAENQECIDLAKEIAAKIDDRPKYDGACHKHASYEIVPVRPDSDVRTLAFRSQDYATFDISGHKGQTFCFHLTSEDPCTAGFRIQLGGRGVGLPHTDENLEVVFDKAWKHEVFLVKALEDTSLIYMQRVDGGDKPIYLVCTPEPNWMKEEKKCIICGQPADDLDEDDVCPGCISDAKYDEWG